MWTSDVITDKVHEERALRLSCRIETAQASNVERTHRYTQEDY